MYLDDDISAFPYVNGGLFSDENIVIPRGSIEQIARRKMEAAKAAMEKAAEKAGNVPDGQVIRFPGDKNNG